MNLTVLISEFILVTAGFYASPLIGAIILASLFVMAIARR